MPSLNWIGKDEVLRYNTPYHTLEKKYTFNAKNSDIMIIKKGIICSKSPSFDFIVYFFV